jgi:hypothetical protein
VRACCMRPTMLATRILLAHSMFTATRTLSRSLTCDSVTHVPRERSSHTLLTCTRTCMFACTRSRTRTCTHPPTRPRTHIRTSIRNRTRTFSRRLLYLHLEQSRHFHTSTDLKLKINIKTPSYDPMGKNHCVRECRVKMHPILVPTIKTCSTYSI